MKFKSILATTFAAIMITACGTDEKGSELPAGKDADVAYVSIKIISQSATRASTEEDATGENELMSLYLITFDASGSINKIPEKNVYYTNITTIPSTNDPDAVKISGSAKGLLVIANPGAKLENIIRNLNAGATFNSVCSAIAGVNVAEISGSQGFAMINSGDETQVNSDNEITAVLVDLTGKIQKSEDFNYDEDQAKNAAEQASNRVSVNLERIAAKVGLKVKTDNGGLEALPAGASFTLGAWTLDAINTTYFPYAKKTLIDVPHTGTFYSKNFYTEDPNFTGPTGLACTEVDEDTYEPVLVHPLGTGGWMADNTTTYCLENTMAAAEQRYGNATRVVIKGTYYPDASWTGDWFNFAGVDYEDFDELKAAYTAADPGSNLIDACDNMYDKIKTYVDKVNAANPGTITFTAADFDGLDATDLDNIPNGGEVIKGAKTDNVIRWYKDGLSYYYYEIRHDDVTTQEMAFGKYGVVRNNWYSLTLGSVSGAGTPWYPDINEPGPGDPDPTDPIDESAGYLGIDIEVAPWIFWEREIGV